MCGIWGFASRYREWEKSVLQNTIRELFLLSESRGKEAAGIAVYSGDEAAVFKRGLSASKMVTLQEYQTYLKKYLLNAKEPFAAIGHSRLVTNGSSFHPENNQPVVKESVITVHNGILTNYEEIWKNHPEFHRSSDVDTEAFTQLIHMHLAHGLFPAHAIAKAYEEIEGMASTCNLLTEDGRLIAATNNGSLYVCVSEDKNSLILASERRILSRLLQKQSVLNQLFREEKIQKIEPQSGLEFSLQDASVPAVFPLSDLKVSKSREETRKCRIMINQEKAEKWVPTHAPVFSIAKYSKYEIDVEPIRKMRRCTKCLLPETMPFIEFDEHGVCNYCRTYHSQKLQGKEKLLDWVEKTRAQKKDGNDSIISFSGGRDSSYGLHYFVKELGLHPVAYSYDWGMVTDLARRNQSRMCSKLGIELIVVSADIHKKRENIRKNVSAWLKNPNLGLVPLFMAGDKQFYYYANLVRKQLGISELLMASNPYEETLFKSGYCGVRPKVLRANVATESKIERLPFMSVAKMTGYYLQQYLKNPSYINSSIIDTALACASFYVIPHDYFRLYDYIRWEENKVNDVLIGEYDWELSPDTESTWRIGDGTAPFYNYIYYWAAGFTENDCLRSNQIREGMLTREEALKLAERDNQPRFESLQWYFDAIGLDMCMVLDTVRKMPRLYLK